jgi:hypothetical protein
MTHEERDGFHDLDRKVAGTKCCEWTNIERYGTGTSGKCRYVTGV